MMWDWPMWGWGMGIGMFIFWGAVLALIVWVVVKLTKREDGEDTRGSKPLDIARERYAKGEISKEEFEQIKKDLS